MKIFFPIGAFYPSQIGGPCNTVYWHVQELAKYNIKSTVATSMLGIKQNQVADDVVLKSENSEIYYSSNVLRISNIKFIYKNLKKADIIHFNGLFNIPVNISLILWILFFKNKKIICSVRGELNPTALKFSRWKKQPSLLLYSIFYKRLLFHATSEQEEKDIKFFFNGSKTIIIPNLLYPADRLQKILKKKQFLFMGRIHEIKALHKFIEALALSKLFKSSDFNFDITGNHEERHENYLKKIKQLIIDLGLQNKIKFSGHITGIEKEKKYAESYFLILPSETENFGNVVVEALNQNTPVLASLGTPWKVLEEYECGFHAENTPENLANYIDKIIEMDDLEYEKLSQNTIKLVDDKFNITTQICKWVNIYKNLKK